MDEKEIEIALTKFGQFDSEITREQEGSGLGLPLTKGLVEVHGGTLTIDQQTWYWNYCQCLPAKRKGDLNWHQRQQQMRWPFEIVIDIVYRCFARTDMKRHVFCVGRAGNAGG